MTEDQVENTRKFVDQFYRDGSKSVVLCADFILYLTDGALQEYQPLLDLYEFVLNRVGTRFTYLKNGDGTRTKARPRDLALLMRRWFESGGPRRGSHVLHLQSGSQPDEASDCAFSFSHVLGNSYVRLIAPVTMCLTSCEAFAEMASGLASPIEFRCGSAGISTDVELDYDASNHNGAMAAISKRFLGIDLGKPLYWCDMTTVAIKTVNWLTFLGHDHLARAAAHVGGESQLAAALAPNVGVTRLPHGVMIQAGAAPGFGDTTLGETLPEYRQVARALRGLKIPPEVLRNYDGIGGTENTRKWLNRFD